MSKLLALAALTMTLAASRAAAESPPHAGSNDDAAYASDSRRASFSPDAERDGPFVAGSPSDDTSYPAPSRTVDTTRQADARVACACCR